MHSDFLRSEHKAALMADGKYETAHISEIKSEEPRS
jgi:hypothetical protein